LIIRGGENVYPVEIEHVLQRHPGISEVPSSASRIGVSAKFEAFIVPIDPHAPPGPKSCALCT